MGIGDKSPDRYEPYAPVHTSQSIGRRLRELHKHIREDPERYRQLCLRASNAARLRVLRRAIQSPDAKHYRKLWRRAKKSRLEA